MADTRTHIRESSAETHHQDGHADQDRLPSLGYHHRGLNLNPCPPCNHAPLPIVVPYLFISFCHLIMMMTTSLGPNPFIRTRPNNEPPLSNHALPLHHNLLGQHLPHHLQLPHNQPHTPNLPGHASSAEMGLVVARVLALSYVAKRAHNPKKKAPWGIGGLCHTA
jgi:hypothetical protein